MLEFYYMCWYHFCLVFKTSLSWLICLVRDDYVFYVAAQSKNLSVPQPLMKPCSPAVALEEL